MIKGIVPPGFVGYVVSNVIESCLGLVIAFPKHPSNRLEIPNSRFGWRSKNDIVEIFDINSCTECSV